MYKNERSKWVPTENAFLKLSSSRETSHTFDDALYLGDADVALMHEALEAPNVCSVIRILHETHPEFVPALFLSDGALMKG